VNSSFHFGAFMISWVNSVTHCWTKYELTIVNSNFLLIEKLLLMRRMLPHDLSVTIAFCLPKNWFCHWFFLIYRNRTIEFVSFIDWKLEKNKRKVRNWVMSRKYLSWNSTHCFCSCIRRSFRRTSNATLRRGDPEDTNTLQKNRIIKKLVVIHIVFIFCFLSLLFFFLIWCGSS
jgi:hypothetical protein